MTQSNLKSQQQVWGTIAGNNISEITTDYEALLRYGIDAIEFRADLMPQAVLVEFLKRNFEVPVFIANFNLDQSVEDCFNEYADRSSGFLFHLNYPNRNKLIDFCTQNQKPFVAAYHSQQPLSYDDIIKKFKEQMTLNPFMLKVGIRAINFRDAIEMISATKFIAENYSYPVAGAVFGNERWARLALHRAGSNVTFVVARELKNEIGNDDKQFTFADFKQLTSIV